MVTHCRTDLIWSAHCALTNQGRSPDFSRLVGASFSAPFVVVLPHKHLVDREQAIRIWIEYPVDRIGENWDSAEL